MENIDKVLSQIQQINVYAMLQEIALKNREQLSEFLIKEQIYNDGIDGSGKKIAPKHGRYSVYSRMYEEIKRNAGLYTGKVDLSFTGDWLRSWKIDINSDSFEIYPPGNELTDKLINQYGYDITEISQSTFDYIVDFFKEKLSIEIKKILQ